MGLRSWFARLTGRAPATEVVDVAPPVPGPPTDADILAALDRPVVGVGAELLGAAAAALAVAVAYVSTREQWGRPIGSFQAVHHRAADMHLDIEAMRCAVYDAAGRADREQPCRGGA